MLSISNPLGRSGARLATLALCGVGFLAACDTDQPVAPKVPAMPADASPSVRTTTTGSLAWQVVDINAALIGGAQFKVVGPMRSTWIVADNGPADSDPAAGKFKVAGLNPGRYTVCETAAPAKYVLPATPCSSVDVAQGVTSTLKDFVNLHLPVYSTEYADIRNNLVGGGSVMIKDSLGAVIMSITDNDATDENPTAGKFQVTLPAPGKYSQCVLMPPPNYVFPPNQIFFCQSFTAYVNGGNHIGPWTVSPLGSVYWSVIDGFYPPNNTPGYVGPSTFKITKSDLTFTADVVDQGANDLDGMVGRVYAKLPGPGTYTICETVAVPNHYLANPACRTVDVVLGVPKWADFFINGLQQVIYNP